MISVWGTPIVATVEQVIKDLKLERFDEGLLREINNTGSDLMCTCPFHKGGKENKPSCGVLLREKVDKNRKYEAGTVHCYTCGYTGDLPQFVADFLGLTSPVQGFKWLVSRYNYSSAEREPLELNLYRGQAEKASYMDEAEVERFYQELKKSSTALEYLKRRALPSWIIDAYKLGFDPEDGVVLFPVRDMSGKVAFYKGRSLVGKHFYNAKDIDKTSQIFGLYEILAEGKASPESEIWITESEIDALSLIGQERLAIALMGSHISEAQCRELENTPFRRFVLALDNDEAGRKGAAQIKRLLIPKGFRFTNLRWDVDLKDINDLITQYRGGFMDYLTGY
jgi:DNA primase